MERSWGFLNMVCHLQVREYKNVINRWVRSKRNQDISYYSSSLSRVVLAALMGVGVVAHVYLNTPSPKWLIYMTDQVRVFLKSWEKLFPGHHLVSYPLCSPCIAGPLGKVQVVVSTLLYPVSLSSGFWDIITDIQISMQRSSSGLLTSRPESANSAKPTALFERRNYSILFNTAGACSSHL